MNLNINLNLNEFNAEQLNEIQKALSVISSQITQIPSFQDFSENNPNHKTQAEIFTYLENSNSGVSPYFLYNIKELQEFESNY